MRKRYRHIIFIDTEFVSSKNIKQPIQISLIAYKISGNQFILERTYSTYITLEDGQHLNRYAKKSTGLDDDILQEKGISPLQARDELLEFLSLYHIEDTLIAGWDVGNDVTMFNVLLNYQGEVFDITDFDWYDVVVPYKHFYHKDSANTPSLAKACEELSIEEEHLHDAYTDAFVTGKIMHHLVLNKSFGVLMQPIYQKNTFKKTK